VALWSAALTITKSASHQIHHIKTGKSTTVDRD